VILAGQTGTDCAVRRFFGRREKRKKVSLDRPNLSFRAEIFRIGAKISTFWHRPAVDLAGFGSGISPKPLQNAHYPLPLSANSV